MYSLDKMNVAHFGTTTIEHFIPLERNGVSGGGANGAIALALLGVGNIQYVTTFDKPKNPVLLDLYEKFENLGIHLVAQEGFKPPISRYSTQAAIDSKTPDLKQIREGNPDFLPASIPALRTINLDAASMVGAPLQNGFTYRSFTEARQILAKRNVPVVVNLNPRAPVDFEITRLLAASAFANALGSSDIKHQLGEDFNARNAGLRILALGRESGSPTSSRIVAVTGGEGEVLYSYIDRHGGTDTFIGRAPKIGRIFSGGDQAGAGDAFAAGMAAGIAQQGITAYTLGLEREQVAQIHETALRAGTDFVWAKNTDRRLAFLNDAIPFDRGNPTESLRAIVGYPPGGPGG